VIDVVVVKTVEEFIGQAFMGIFVGANVIWGRYFRIVGVLHLCKNLASIVRGPTRSNNLDGLAFPSPAGIVTIGTLEESFLDDKVSFIKKPRTKHSFLSSVRCETVDHKGKKRPSIGLLINK